MRHLVARVGVEAARSGLKPSNLDSGAGGAGDRFPGLALFYEVAQLNTRVIPFANEAAVIEFAKVA